MKEETKDKFLVHDTIISWACIIWAVASIGLMIYFTGLNQVTFTIITFGQLFLFMGIIAICKKQPTGGIFTVTGIGCIIIPAINEWAPLFNDKFTSNNIFPILITTGIAVVGLAMMICPGLLEKIAKKKCKVVVKAECVDFIEAELADGKKAYAPVYMYRYNEKDYVKCREKYSTKQEISIGSTVDLKINEKNPEEVYFEASKASKMLIYIFGASFFIAGIGMLLTTLAAIQ